MVIFPFTIPKSKLTTPSIDQLGLTGMRFTECPFFGFRVHSFQIMEFFNWSDIVGEVELAIGNFKGA